MVSNQINAKSENKTEVLESWQIKENEWKEITNELKNWVNDKGDLDDLTDLICEALDSEKIEREALNCLSVVGALIDSKELWRLNNSTNWSYYEDVRDLLEDKNFLNRLIENDEVSWKIEEYLAERQSQAIAYEIRELLNDFTY